MYFIARQTSFRDLERLQESQGAVPVEMVEVEISGCVRKSGRYQIPAGSSVLPALRKARPLPFADMTNISLDEPISVPIRIEIPRLEKIIVFVEGCVETSVRLELPAGSRVCDLKGRIELAQGADLQYLKRRRLLKNQERVVVPRRRDECY